jgi:hypothetical protein
MRHIIIPNEGGNSGGQGKWDYNICISTETQGKFTETCHLRGLQAGSVSIIESNIEWQEYEWRENK